ncbi:MAG TPA: glutathione S-transferase N-terminal domain-containing protein [Burkholderiales bacterium]|nr:glutathione S-transferase N-terminal domain-containing protein [Burkholderiales bacterium]
MKLIGSLTSPYVRKVRIVAAEKRIEYEWMLENPWSGDTSVVQFNPLGKVPVLILDDGSSLFDSRVICEFLDNVSPIAKLLPQGNRERIQVKRWEALADGVLDAGVAARLENNRPEHERSLGWTTRQLSKVEQGLDAMDAELGAQAWCSGGAFSLADVSVIACLGWLDFRFPQNDWRGKRANLKRHAEKLADRPSVAETLPRE